MFTGAGLLRDAQKWVALAVPFYALAAAAAVMWAGNRFSLPRPAFSVAAVVVTIVVLPDLVWGVGGALKPVHYPPGSWTVVADQLRDETGDVAVLPAGMFRAFPPYSGDAPVLDLHHASCPSTFCRPANWWLPVVLSAARGLGQLGSRTYCWPAEVLRSWPISESDGY